MFTNNPYAQGGWYNPQNPHSINAHPWFPNSAHPPTFGALPSPTYSTSSNLSFDFSPLNPDILNCVVNGPGRRVYFSVVTTHSSTVISKPNGEAMARIDWQCHPEIEIKSVAPRQQVAQWLNLSVDQSYRTMIVHGRAYVWVPRNGDVILFSSGPAPPVELGKITRSSSRVILEITGDALRAGLLEASVVATVLFQSGRNIA